MKRLGESLLVATGVAVLCLVLSTLHSGSAAAVMPSSPQTTTHLGVPATDIVVLWKPGFGDAVGPLFRVHPNGTQETTPFVVPEGRFFVATDFEWGVRLMSPGQVSTFRAGYKDPDDLLVERILHRNSVTSTSSTAHASVNATTGFVAGPGMEVVAGLITPGTRGDQIIRGYFVDVAPFALKTDFILVKPGDGKNPPPGPIQDN